MNAKKLNFCICLAIASALIGSRIGGVEDIRLKLFVLFSALSLIALSFALIFEGKPDHTGRVIKLTFCSGFMLGGVSILLGSRPTGDVGTRVLLGMFLFALGAGIISHDMWLFKRHNETKLLNPETEPAE